MVGGEPIINQERNGFSYTSEYKPYDKAIELNLVCRKMVDMPFCAKFPVVGMDHSGCAG